MLSVNYIEFFLSRREIVKYYDYDSGLRFITHLLPIGNLKSIHHGNRLEQKLIGLINIQ